MEFTVTRCKGKCYPLILRRVAGKGGAVDWKIGSVEAANRNGTCPQIGLSISAVSLVK